MKYTLQTTSALVFISAAMLATSAVAESSDADIVVTGSRLRNEAVQDTPIAVSVIGNSTLDSRQAKDIESLSAVVPNLQIQDAAVGPNIPAISMRGFSTLASDVSAEPGVSLYVDGVYQPQISGALVDTFDLEKAEVLRGPQGALIGKNSGAGAILITRSRPTGELGGKLEVEGGSKHLAAIRTVVNVPIVEDKLAGKLFATYRTRGSYIKNLTPGEKDQGAERNMAVRGALSYTPTDNFDLYLSADYASDRSQIHAGRSVSNSSSLSCLFFGVCAPHAGLKNVTGAGFLDHPATDESNWVAQANWTLGGAKLTSISGYRWYSEDNSLDLDNSPFPIIEAHHQINNIKQYSEEVRLSSVDGGGLDMGGKLHWLIAGFYSDYQGYGVLPLLIFATPQSQSQKSDKTTKAIFGHVDYDLTDAWTISGGVRKSWDDVDHRFSLATVGSFVAPPLAFKDTADFTNTSYEAGTQYKLAPNKMVYFRYAEGYRGGGFVGFPGGSDPVSRGVIQPETSKNLEVGLKTEWFDRRVLFNLTLFDTKFNNMQRSVVLAGPGGGFVQATQNAATAKTRGVEVESHYRATDDTTFTVNVGYLDAKFNKFVVNDPVAGVTYDFSDLDLAFAPKWTASASVDHKVHFGEGFAGFNELDFNASYDWRSHFFTSGTNDPSGYSKSYGLLNVSGTFVADNGVYVSVYGSNLTDEEYLQLGDNVSGVIQHQYDNIGRVYGVKLGYNF